MITYSDNVDIGTAIIMVSFSGFYKGTATGSFVISESFEKIPKAQTILKNKTTYYRVTKKGKEVRFIRPVNKNKAVITVPATVRLRGHRYKVTSIAKNAFRGNQKVKKIYYVFVQVQQLGFQIHLSNIIMHNILHI